MEQMCMQNKCKQASIYSPAQSEGKISIPPPQKIRLNAYAYIQTGRTISHSFFFFLQLKLFVLVLFIF